MRDFSQHVKNITDATSRKEAIGIVEPVMEMQLLREIKDKIDELQTMKEIFKDQRIIIEDLLKLLDGPETALDGVSQDELAVLVDSRLGDIQWMIS